MKKILKILLVVLILFNTNSAFANTATPTVNDDVAMAVGAYATGALTASSLETINMFQDAGETTKAYAKTIWSVAEPTVKAQWASAIDTAMNVGSTVVNMTQDVANWAQSTIQGKVNTDIKSSITIATADYGLSIYSEFEMGATMYGIALHGKPVIGGMKQVISINKVEYSGGTNLKIYFTELTWNDVIQNVTTTVTLTADEQALMPNIDNWADEVGRSLQNVFTGAVATGVNIPLDSIYGRTATGDPAWYNPRAKTWENGKGVAFPVDVPITEPYVGNPPDDWVKEDNPPIEENPPIEGNPPITGEYGGVLSNILTKVTAVATALTTGLIGDFNNVNWEKLKMTGQAFSTKFPFSLPWDVGRALNAIFGEFSTSDIPTWDIRFNVLDRTFDWELTIPEFFYNWFTVLKTMILVMFDITLVYSVRKLLGGAS